MGRFSRKIKRNPAKGFVGKKVQLKQLRKIMTKAQRDYWKGLKGGTIQPSAEESNDEQE